MKRYLPLSRTVVFILLGIAGLLLVFRYSGPYFNLVHSYGANLSASFACYFIASIAVARVRSSRPASALITLFVVEAFEATDGFFGVMTNVYDPLDYLVNALGVGLAVLVDVVAAYVSRRWERRRKVVLDHPPETDTA
jgi:hypothetical protein